MKRSSRYPSLTDFVAARKYGHEVLEVIRNLQEEFWQEFRYAFSLHLQRQAFLGDGLRTQLGILLNKTMVKYLINPENATLDEKTEHVVLPMATADTLEHMKAMQVLTDKHLVALDTYRGCGEVPQNVNSVIIFTWDWR
jgi:hypothetical protein